VAARRYQDRGPPPPSWRYHEDSLANLIRHSWPIRAN
jgi:hypothetical protein